MEKLSDKQLVTARQEFKPYLASNHNVFSKLKLKTPLSAFSQKLNTTFESLGCVGYNAAKKQLTATINIKRTTGYSGSLCTNGSYEYVRFYMDYQNGDGWEDMGVVGVNVHDIATSKDCDGNNETPINYVVRLDINPKRANCTSANLPVVRAVLAWNVIPEPNDPELTIGTYVWSDKKDAQIQMDAYKFFIPNFPIFELDDLFHSAILNPNISLNQLSVEHPEKLSVLNKAKASLMPKALSFTELSGLYNSEKIKPHRFGYKELHQAMHISDSIAYNEISNMFEVNNWNLNDSLVDLNTLNCDTQYEELVCVGADYHREALVGTIKIKKSSGYNGGLCTAGSKEYVSFWIQNEENCEWVHAGTSHVTVHDIQEVPDNGLFYSVVLPYHFDGLKKDCTKPQVLKVKAVLSWNVAPDGMACSRWGNILESYVQLQPKRVFEGEGPEIVAIGGVDIDYINATGLTIPSAHFKFTGLPVTSGSAFGGLIIVEAETNAFDGQRYKVRVDNMSDGSSYYVSNSFIMDEVIYVSNPDPVTNEYTYYGDASNNSLNAVAKFYHPTNDAIRITIEHMDGTSFSKIIQMDNASPVLELNIENYGDCSHFIKGLPIKGDFSVSESHIEYYRLSTNINNIPVTILEHVTPTNPADTAFSGNFEFTASTTKNCGAITLYAKPRTIVNSIKMHDGRHLPKTICLKGN